ncbi:hypothetical protein ACLOJK_004520, partial [Asimina triloba]
TDLHQQIWATTDPAPNPNHPSIHAVDSKGAAHQIASSSDHHGRFALPLQHRCSPQIRIHLQQPRVHPSKREAINHGHASDQTATKYQRLDPAIPAPFSRLILPGVFMSSSYRPAIPASSLPFSISQAGRGPDDSQHRFKTGRSSQQHQPQSLPQKFRSTASEKSEFESIKDTTNPTEKGAQFGSEQRRDE